VQDDVDTTQDQSLQAKVDPVKLENLIRFLLIEKMDPLSAREVEIELLDMLASDGT
jgi:hypothetical protein